MTCTITRCGAGADLGGGCRGCELPPPPEMTCFFLIQLVFCEYSGIGVEVEQETSAPPPKKNTGSAPVESVIIKSGPGCSNVG